METVALVVVGWLVLLAVLVLLRWRAAKDRPDETLREVTFDHAQQEVRPVYTTNHYRRMSRRPRQHPVARKRRTGRWE
jgi:hypothetical protein